jgi:hypothetical protein
MHVADRLSGVLFAGRLSVREEVLERREVAEHGLLHGRLLQQGPPSRSNRLEYSRKRRGRRMQLCSGARFAPRSLSCWSRHGVASLVGCAGSSSRDGMHSSSDSTTECPASPSLHLRLSTAPPSPPTTTTTSSTIRPTACSPGLPAPEKPLGAVRSIPGLHRCPASTQGLDCSVSRAWPIAGSALHIAAQRSSSLSSAQGSRGSALGHRVIKQHVGVPPVIRSGGASTLEAV